MRRLRLALPFLVLALIPNLAFAQTDACPDCVIGVYDDMALTQTTGAFNFPTQTTKDVFLGIKYSGGTIPSEMSGVEFSILGLDGFIVLTEAFDNPTVELGAPAAPADTVNGTGGLNIAWADCLQGDRAFMKLTLIAFAPVADDITLQVVRKFPPTNPNNAFPLFVQCDPPVFSVASVSGGSYVLNPTSQPCAISDLAEGNQSACDPGTNTYTQDVIVTYSNPPATGDLVVNGQAFAITGSPQTVTLTDLAADAAPVNVTASFSDDAGCSRSETALFTAPADCAPCSIDALEAGAQSACDPGTNTYTQVVIVTYSNPPDTGNLDVNGQSFAITTSPQSVTLTGLVADGGAVDVTASFSADAQCTLMVTSLFTAPQNCEPPPCAITALAAGDQSACDPETNTYTQDVTVTYENAPASGTLDLDLAGGASGTQSFAITTSPQTVTLTNLPSNALAVNVTASFSADSGCSLTQASLFTAPVECTVPCEISDLATGAQSDCDLETNTYSQDVVVTYANEPGTGNLLVNGQAFAITGSPQTVTLTGLDADAQPVDVTASFSANPACTLTAPNLFTAPMPCRMPCEIQPLQAGAQTPCDSTTNRYTQEVIVTYQGAPSSGSLVVNGQSFAITGSPQTVTLTNLLANGAAVSVMASFSAEPSCSQTAMALFTAPESCQEGPGVKAFVFLADDEVRIEEPDNSEGNIHSNGDIEFDDGDDDRSIHTGDLTAVDDIEIEDDNIIEGSVSAGDDIDIDDDAEVRGAVMENVAVDRIPIPEVPDFEPGDEDVDVDDDESLELLPGDYDDVDVEEEGRLTLRSGEYNLESLELDDESFLCIEIDAGLPVIINVEKKLRFKDEVMMKLSPLGSPTGLVTINYAGGRKVKLGKRSVIFGTFIAPDAEVRLEKDVFFKGTICAEEIRTKDRSRFVPHGSSVPLPLVVLPTPVIAENEPSTRTNEPSAKNELSLHPNPFNPMTTLSFATPQAGPASLRVYSVSGKLVRTLMSGVVQAGRHSVVWNGRDQYGGQMASGIYFAVFRTAHEKQTRRMVLLK